VAISLLLLLLLSLLAQDGFSGQLDFVTFQADDLHHDLIALLENIPNISNAVFVDFRDVEQPVGSREQFDKGAEIRNANDFSTVSFSYLRSRRQI